MDRRTAVSNNGPSGLNLCRRLRRSSCAISASLRRIHMDHILSEGEAAGYDTWLDLFVFRNPHEGVDAARKNEAFRSARALL